MPQTTSDPFDQRLVKVLAHPLRVRVLAVLNDRVASPVQMADQFDENLGRVSYHVKVLLKYGVIELVSTRPRRGATEHFYRGATRTYLSDPQWSMSLLPVIVDEQGWREIASIMARAFTQVLKAQTKSDARLVRARKRRAPRRAALSASTRS